jgi:hypothetical protein
VYQTLYPRYGDRGVDPVSQKQRKVLFQEASHG